MCPTIHPTIYPTIHPIIYPIIHPTIYLTSEGPHVEQLINACRPVEIDCP